MSGADRPVASFHLVRYETGAVPHQLARVGTQRRARAAVPGLRFGRVLGTGKGSSTAFGADLRRWALFCAWESEDALDRFLDTSPLFDQWRRRGREMWSVRLEPLGAHGSWGGRPLGKEWMAAAMATPVLVDAAPGPIAVLTRASVRAGRLVTFHRAAKALSPQLEHQPGLLAHVGVGELPVARLGTMSFWSSGAAIDEFNRRQQVHRDIVRRTRQQGWYAEELFARFRPYASSGTWDGRDPLADVAAN